MALAEWREQFLRFWRNLGARQRYMIAGSAAVLFIALLGWSFWLGSKPDLVPLFTDMEARDAGEVREKLKELKVYHEIGGNGNTILVPSKDVYRVRLDLASQGLPRGNKGFEVFDQNKFGVTEFQNKVFYLQALQGELTKTIEQMVEVEKARVHIVLPEDSLYKKNEKPATASIMLKLRPRAQLSREQVKGIVNLVAHSIQGLKPENITVVDNFSRILNDPAEAQAGTGITLSQLEMTKKVQDDVQKRVQSLLDEVLGPGKAVARVNVELNFDQRTVDKQVFEPVVDDKGIVRSSQEMAESYRGNAGQAGGPPGTVSNIPGYVTNPGNSQSNYEKKEVTRNYEINETKEKIVVAPGAVRRLTIALLVDAVVNKQQQDSLAKVVSSATGVNAARGDIITVESIPFSTEVADKQKQEEAEAVKQKQLQQYLTAGAAVLALLAVLYLASRFYRSRKRQELEMRERMELEAISSAQIQDVAVREQEMSEQDRQVAEQRAAIEKLARNNPEDVANLVRSWLAEE